MYKYAVVTPAFRGMISGKIQQTRTIFGAIGAVLGHRKGCKSRDLG